MGRRLDKTQMIVQHFYNKTILNAQELNKLTGLSTPTIYRIISDLSKLGILSETNSAGRGKVYVFRAYLNLFT